ncbi:MAG: beta-ketoacyl-[acyl-carrier-protein] synthase family protein [Bacteroidetes bacterium]|nr:beta-ketoacyl-[acyl-carrier-protein] synthase family protein [Bacteroidota bacterium]
MRVFIAGKGVISAIGKGVSETLTSFRTGQSGIGKISVLTTNYGGKIPAAEVKLNNRELAKLSGLSEEAPRTALLSMIAAEEAMKDAAIPEIGRWRVGFISANTVGAMDKTEDIFGDYMADSSSEKLIDEVNYDTGYVTELVADKLRIKDHITTISTACSSSSSSLMYGARMIKNNLLDVVLAGGADALSRFTLNGFNSLMILDSNPCTPYDENRKGLNLGEGAGYVVLVSEKVAATLAEMPEIVLSGYSNANDAFHQTASSPEGKGNFLAMKKALEMSGLDPKDIDYINLHGTGTPNNDLSEGVAIQRIFGKVPDASSTKTFTGHTLGGSGGIEAVFSLMAMEEGVIFPNLRFQTKMKELDFVPVTKLKENKEVNHVMSNSFGFGGNCSSLIFSKVKG